MGSRKEEERNEKIIRGLMKLPPNRRCINCNSLGPQFVCTNFWTFVCMTCSGIHREFTHRVKSVSMSKFTSQDVEALQNGGNQRAREIYLKDWDQQRQRLPDNSNVDKIREFIKSIYVDKKYAGGKTHDKPPRDLQRMRSHEDETRRASSYHSYSQSPPYDYQYEDRRYGKQAGILTRKPGSDRGLYVGKMSSFICSPTRLSDRMFEDRFANEGSVSGVSDYSVSSGGELVTTESPNYSSPPIQTPKNILGEDVQQRRIDLFSEANFKRGAEGIPHSQRSASLGSIGSFDSNSVSVKSFNSSSLADIVSEPEQATGTHQDKMPTFQRMAGSGSYDSLDHFKAPVVPKADASVGSPIDLFQLSATSPAPPVNLFEISPLDPAPAMNAYQTPQTSLPSSIDLFGGITQQQSINSVDQNSPELSIPKNEGWATFDIQPTTSTQGNGNLTPFVISTSMYSSAQFDQVSSSDKGMQWPPFQNSSVEESASGSAPWNNGLHNVEVPDNTSAQTWNAFEDSVTHLSLEGTTQSSIQQVAASMPSTGDQSSGLKASEDPSRDGIKRVAPHGQGELSGLDGQSDILLEPSYTPPANPIMEPAQSHANNHKSNNPFDLPYDSELEPGNMFLDMSSLQAALPDAHLQSAFLGSGMTEPWFPQDPVTTYVPAAPQGGLAYMGGQAPNPNVQTQGPVAFVGGNPFA
ncbi:HIV-1 rev binding protein, hrbl, putative [Ricinus communis]|uniref:HIV-1 rev binding protein, hrbl, putative n=1 Tax=Ricinus communis TaxID=3988 RepID=B9SY84_RICCO|nr:HIV-1 rev binding protein, hrbl, putative [Ricinus communis]|eukprot:XP_002530953.1 probable ADP-ribosylation factor GTPase-activating protein AGD14 [Ricinus communis]